MQVDICYECSLDTNVQYLASTKSVCYDFQVYIVCKIPTEETCKTKEVGPNEVVVILRQIYRNGFNIAQGCGLSNVDPVPHKEIKVTFMYFFFSYLLEV